MKQIRFTNSQVTRKRRHIGNVILAWLMVLVIVVIVLVLGVKIFIALGYNRLRNSPVSTMPVFVEEDTGTEEPLPTTWQEGWVRYNGKVYEYNEDILTFLVMGIDKLDKVEKNPDLVSGGQADALFLVVADSDTKKISLVGVNRDTMVDIIMVGLGENGGDLITTAEIAVQHGFGDGLEQSCELTRDAVSKLFYDLPIHGYVSFNMGGLADLSDAIGGVELTVLEDLSKVNKQWVEGAEVVLQGKDTYDYVHYRDITKFESARGRLARQKQFLSIFAKTALGKVKEDITFPIQLYQSFKPYIVTDFSIDEISWIASELVKYQFDGEDIYTLEGTTKMGEQFEEFYPDKEALKGLMIELFYREVDVEPQAED